MSAYCVCKIASNSSHLAEQLHWRAHLLLTDLLIFLLLGRRL